MRKRAILIVGVALLIAAAGLVYAHWTETLTMSVGVGTGCIDPNWMGSWTDDDGGGAEETGLTAAVWSSFNPPSTRDPRQFSYPNLADTDAERYDKDVATCGSGTPGAPANGFFVDIINAYPSYHCTVFNTIQNQCTVPVKVEAINFYITRDPDGGGAALPVALPVCTGANFPCLALAGNTITVMGPTGLAEMDMVGLAGPICGTQVDPGLDAEQFISGYHVLNASTNESVNYAVQGNITFYNWNESSFPTPIADMMRCTNFVTSPLF